MPRPAMFPTRFLSHPNMPTAAQLRKTSTGPLYLVLALSTLPELFQNVNQMMPLLCLVPFVCLASPSPKDKDQNLKWGLYAPATLSSFHPMPLSSFPRNHYVSGGHPFNK